MDQLPLDSEVKAMQELLEELQGQTYKTQDRDRFDEMIKHRYAEIGWRVEVLWYSAAGPDGIEIRDVAIPEITVVDRIKPLKAGEFDYDQMRHEVVSNVLGLPEADAGLIKPDETWKAPQHKHSAGCGH
jgi:hypothetical protein